MTNGAQARNRENLLEGILPQVLFIDVDPSVVMERENQLVAAGPRLPPHGDVGLLEALIQLKPTSPKLFTSRELLRVMQNDQLAEHFRHLAQTTSIVSNHFTELESYRAFEAAVKRRPAIRRFSVEPGSFSASWSEHSS